MNAMRIVVMATLAALATGCGAYYEEVPAFGQTDPNAAVSDQPQQVRQTQADNPTQIAGYAGQEVNLDDPAPQDQYADTDPSALTDFKSALDPYGTWADDTQYGTVWEPDPGVVGNDFAPYVTGGHWSYDQDDYTWVSDYDWGWAPFHYGRWIYIAGRGWCWIPGRRYAGAWVDWRVGDAGFGYIGWGPLAPTWYWRDGLAYDIGWAINTPYVFCGTGDFFSPNVGGRILAGPQVGVVAGRTHVYRDGRTAARPTVGPPPSRFGMAPPPIPALANTGIARARAFARPSTAVSLGAHAPAYTLARPQGTFRGSRSLGMNNVDRPVVTAPQYRGVQPMPYRVPYRSPYPVYRGAPSYDRAPTYDRGPAYQGGPVYRGGGPVYRGAPSSPEFRGPPVYRGGGGGGGFRGAAPPPPTTYSHPTYHGGGSSSTSHSSGGHYSGHFGGGGGRHR